MKVYLVGYMGVGKSTIGKKLARRLETTFYDLDSIIVSEWGMSIPEIFRKKGEKFFRTVEAEALEKQIKNSQSFVLATGGGAVLREGAMEKLRDSGLVIWLKMSPKMLASRLEQSKEKRPLLDGVNNYELFITNHLKERIPFYSKAQIHYAASQNDAEHLEILAREIADYSK